MSTKHLPDDSIIISSCMFCHSPLSVLGKSDVGAECSTTFWKCKNCHEIAMWACEPCANSEETAAILDAISEQCKDDNS